MKQYEKYMKQCIKLAQKAVGNTSPNPMVGCVILNPEGKVISTGYHKHYGENHAERDALLKIENSKNATLIVNLEPCSHYGKTPPCADLIIEKGIKKVVYGMKDPNPLVCGKGLKELEKAGIEIIGPVLEDECKKLNEVFFKNQTKRQIFVALKTATTIDGKIATSTGDSKWITSQKARNEVKNIRAQYDAILTSSKTIIADNPLMIHKNKIILDTNLKTTTDFNIYKTGKIYIYNSIKSKIKGNYKYIKTPIRGEYLDIEFILNDLYNQGFMSILVESGGTLNGGFLPYIDKLYHFIAPKILSDNTGLSCFSGIQADKISQCFNLKYETTKCYDPDILNIYSKV